MDRGGLGLVQQRLIKDFGAVGSSAFEGLNRPKGRTTRIPRCHLEAGQGFYKRREAGIGLSTSANDNVAEGLPRAIEGSLVGGQIRGLVQDTPCLPVIWVEVDQRQGGLNPIAFLDVGLAQPMLQERYCWECGLSEFRDPRQPTRSGG